MGDRRSIRLRGYDYSGNGHYFVTICSQNREEIFGEMVGAKRDSPKMRLNKNGLIVEKIWKSLTKHNPIIIDEFCIMPNHIHMIVVIQNVGARLIAPKKELVYQGLINQTPTLGQIIRYLKGKCCYEIRKDFKYFRWQRNYYEHIIKNETEYLKIKQYIKLNPAMWERDRNNSRI